MQRRHILLILITLLLILAYPSLRLIIALVATQPEYVGIGELAPCPDSPNCVSSFADATDQIHYTEPISYTGTADHVQSELIAILDELPRTRIESNQAGYIHAVRVSPAMRFPDDLEFLFDADASLIHVRSAARLGEGDMGKNREHIAIIRAVLAERQ